MLKWIKNRLSEVIRCDEQDFLLWKWHPKDAEENRDDRENRICHGSELRVKENMAAVFFCPQTNGTIMEFYEGPCDAILETENLPVLSDINRLFNWKNPPLQAEVYFINLTPRLRMRFGVPFFQVNSDNQTRVNLAVRGTLFYRIADYREFLSLYGLKTMGQDDLKFVMKEKLCTVIRKTMMGYFSSNSQKILNHDIEEIEHIIQTEIKKTFNSGHGIKIEEVMLSAIEVEG